MGKPASEAASSKSASVRERLGSSGKRTEQKRKLRCHHCRKEHPLYRCDDFLALIVQNRYDLVRKWNLCFNCLSDSHRLKQCRYGPCQRCGAKHNSVLCQKVRSEIHLVEKKVDKKPRKSSAERNEERAAKDSEGLML